MSEKEPTDEQKAGIKKLFPEVGQPYVGKPGQALKEFKMVYSLGITKNWPAPWDGFADHLFNDITHLEELAARYEGLSK